MTVLAVETVSCMALYGGATDCSREDCGGAPYIPGNNRAADAEVPSDERDAADGAPAPTDADANEDRDGDATTAQDAQDAARD